MVRAAVLANERKRDKAPEKVDEPEGAVGGAPAPPPPPPAPAVPAPNGHPEILSRKERKAIKDKQDDLETFGLFYRTFMTKTMEIEGNIRHMGTKTKPKLE